MIISKPSPREEFYFSRYIDLATKEDLISSLEASRKEVQEVLEPLSETQSNFARLLIEAGRLTLALDISALYERERAKSEGRANVSIVSAFELDDAQRDALTQSMAKRLGREIDLEVAVDDALIGGVIIRSGDVVIDASLRGRLRQLEAEFL